MTELRWDNGTLVHLSTPEWLADDALQTLMHAFENAGYVIYAVGGCVRDTALDRPVKDVDLSTDARPEKTTAVINSLPDWKAVPTGADHGTITAVAPNGASVFEVTTFRTDVETDGRHATVAFSDNIADDAMRRDFTINAFYANRQGRVTDVVGGSADLLAQRIRFIGDPADRIREDYLRILRFFRFTASHGKTDDGIDAEGLAACAGLADGLSGLSRERIGVEMKRMMALPDCAPVIGSMEMSGVLMRILPGATVLTLARLIDLENTLPMQPDVPTRLASLGCTEVADRLRLSKAEADKVTLVIQQAGTLMPPHELGYRFGIPDAEHCLLLRWATLLQPIDRQAIVDVQTGASAECPVKARDLMPAFEGKALGVRLKHLETAWIASRFAATKADLLALP